MNRPSQAVVDLFDRIRPDEPGVERRQMFGMPTAFVNGNMFMGLFEESVMVRLPQEARAELVAQGGEPFAPGGRVMREYIAIPDALGTGEEVLRGWAGRALEFVVAMPPKVPKPRRPRRQSA